MHFRDAIIDVCTKRATRRKVTAMTRYANPFRIAVETYDAHPEMTKGHRAFWFDSFWDEWDDMTHDGNCIFEMFNDQLSATEEVVDYENRLAYINEILLDGDANDNPADVWPTPDHEARVERQRALLLIAADIVDQTWAAYPETRDAFISSRNWAAALDRLRLNLPHESVQLDFELGSEHSNFERIVRTLFDVHNGKVA